MPCHIDLHVHDVVEQVVVLVLAVSGEEHIRVLAVDVSAPREHRHHAGHVAVADVVLLPRRAVEDALRARGIAREMAKTGCLRTVAEWREWYLRFAYGKGRRIVTSQRAVLMSLVIAHRQGVVAIPWLADRDRTVVEKLAWLSEWGLGTVSRGDWDNARRPERASQMLPLDMLTPYLDRMTSMAPGNHPTDVHRLPY